MLGPYFGALSSPSNQPIPRRNVLDLHAGSAAVFLADLAVLVAVAIVETRLASLSTPRVTAASPSADRWSNARD
jgi:hypothetical protein